METDEVSAENLPCWMLDTNYNGMAFYASQVFFPKTSAWNNLQKSLKAIRGQRLGASRGTASEPFALATGTHRGQGHRRARHELMVAKGAETAS